MTDPETDPSLQLAQAAAAQLGAAEWSLDAEPVWDEEPAEEAEPPPVPVPEPPKLGNILPPENTPAPPTPTKILEAMLFVGGGPLTAAEACSAIRGLSHGEFRDMVEELARKYRVQKRPYAVVPQGDGFALELLPRFRSLKDRLRGGTKEVELTQPALDALSLVAYRQPASKADLDALTGTDTAAPLRMLARLGLVSSSAAGYVTTPKFLATFGLASLDDLPRLGDVAG
jgi:segregation and condensation protein B